MNEYRGSSKKEAILAFAMAALLIGSVFVGAFTMARIAYAQEAGDSAASESSSSTDSSDNSETTSSEDTSSSTSETSEEASETSDTSEPAANDGAEGGDSDSEDTSSSGESDTPESSDASSSSVDNTNSTSATDDSSNTNDNSTSSSTSASNDNSTDTSSDVSDDAPASDSGSENITSSSSETDVQLVPELSTNKEAYSPGEIVQLRGSNLSPNSSYDLYVFRGDGWIVKSNGEEGYDTITTDASGAFDYTYELPSVNGEWMIIIYESEDVDRMFPLALTTFENSAPTLWTDKYDYDPSETAIISGKGFNAGTSYDIVIERPDGSIIKGDGTFTDGFDSVTTDSKGRLSYSYILNGIPGSYQIYAYASSDVSHQELIARAGFADANTGPLYGGTATSTTWLNPANAQGAADNSCATSSGNTQFIEITSFNFTSAMIPSGSTLTGVTVEVDGASSGNNKNINVQLRTASGLVGSVASFNGIPEGSCSLLPTDNFVTVPAPTTATWGATLTQADVTSSGFGVRITQSSAAFSRLIDSVRITITFTATTGTLTVIKSVTNDNGGTLDASDFNIHVKSGGTDVAGSPQAGSTTRTTYTLSPGTYTVSEDPVTGYQASFSASCPSGSVTITAGGSVTCSITNDDVQPTLTVIKIIENDNGGTATTDDFTLYVNGSQVTNGTSNGFDAGFYNVTESGLFGYDGSFSGDCDQFGGVTLGVGEEKTCVINNDDIQPTLKVIKYIVNNNGGTATIGDFVLYVNSTVITNNTSTGFDAGFYNVSESGPFGYDATFAGDCDAFGGILLSVGDDVTCTITNDDVQPKLTVIKYITNDNGGTAQLDDFAFYVNTTQVINGTANGFDAGFYSVTEISAVTSYSTVFTGDCDEFGGIVLNVGDDKTCIITNDDIAPKLTIIKYITNDNGGSATVDDFSFFVNGSQVTNGTENTLGTAGFYNVTETGPFGYDATFSGNCDQYGGVTLDIGEEKTCVITNDDIQPQLTVIKYIVNDNGGEALITDFTLYVNSTIVSNGTATGFDAGFYNVSEVSAVSGYNTTFTGDCDSDGGITLNIGEEKTCVITNDDIAPKLVFTKYIINDNGGTETDFGPFMANSTILQNNTMNILPSAGTYIITENVDLSRYTATFGDDCAPSGQLTIGIGDVLTCTITNDDIKPILTVIKIIVNNNGGTATIADFALYVNTTEVINGTSTGFNAGFYNISEIAGVSGYDASFSGDCDAFGGITLDIGDDKTCIITNDDIAPKLTIIKHIINDNGGTAQLSDFEFFINGTISAENNTAVTLPTAGFYNVTESGPFGYAVSFSDDCTELSEGVGGVTLNIGEELTCTITNDDIQPILTVFKEIINDNGGIATLTNFTFYVNTTQVTNGTTTGFDAGFYNVTETDLFSYSATFSGDCDEFGGITLHIGEEKVCNITNDDIQPILIVIKHVINDNGGNNEASDFTMSVDGNSVSPSSFAGEESPGTTVSLNAGPYSVDETGPSGYARSDSAECAGAISVGETLTCTITNDDEAPTVTLIKEVINDHAGTADADNFGISVNGTVVTSGSTTALYSNTPFAIDEAGLAGYEFVSITGDAKCPADLGGMVTLDEGEDITCTITNDDLPVEISGTKFNDVNGDGIRDTSDDGLEGWVIFLDANNNDELDGDETSTTTNSTGGYTFADLPAGTHRVREVQQDGWTQTTDNPADIIAANGDNISDVNFGNFENVAISGQKFEDHDGDGTKDAGDQGLVGWTINLSNGTGIIMTDVTDSNGNYEFANLPPGTYNVTEVNQAGWTQTTANPPLITALSGVNSTGIDFGNFQNIAISGMKFNDINGNGIKDGSDAGLAGWVIYIDSNSNDVKESGELFATTDTNGNYQIADVGPGTHSVKEVLQSGWHQTYPQHYPLPPGSHSVIAASGTNVSDKNFGNIVIISITGFYRPVDMDTPTITALNVVKAGSTVPLKFNLYQGGTPLTDISYIQSITSKQVNCDGSASAYPVEEIVTTGGTGLRWDSTSGQFIDNWKTPNKPNVCIDVTMTAVDGSSIMAHFKTK